MKNLISTAQQHLQKMATFKELIYGGMLYVAFQPALVNAGFLSRGLCRPYRLLVDNELFMVAALVAATILVVAFKLSPSGTVLSKGIGIMAGLMIALNLENLIQAMAGGGVFC